MSHVSALCPSLLGLKELSEADKKPLLDPRSLCYLYVSVTKSSSPEKNDSRAGGCWDWFRDISQFLLVGRLHSQPHLSEHGYHSVWFLTYPFLSFPPFLTGTPSFLVLFLLTHQDPQSLWRSSSFLPNPHRSSETSLFLSLNPGPLLWPLLKSLFSPNSSAS